MIRDRRTDGCNTATVREANLSDQVLAMQRPQKRLPPPPLLLLLQGQSPKQDIGHDDDPDARTDRRTILSYRLVARLSDERSLARKKKGYILASRQREAKSWCLLLFMTFFLTDS